MEDRRERHERVVFRQVSAWANANTGDALSTRVNVTDVLHLPTSESETYSVWVADFRVDGTVLHESVWVETFRFWVFSGVAEDVPSMRETQR